MNNKREMIERALGFLEYRGREAVWWHELVDRLDALAEQAIVLPVEIEHQRLEHQYKPVYDKDVTYIRGGENNLWHLIYDATLGTPGKAIAIILPLDNHKG